MTPQPKRTDGCPRKLQPGGYKRIPADATRPPIGFYFACPYCGFRCVIVLASDHGPVEEKDGNLISFTGIETCAMCHNALGMKDGAFV